MATIRLADTDDIAGIQRVARATWQAAYSDFVGEESIETVLDEWYATEIVDQAVTADEVVYLVAERNDGIVGYTSGGEGSEGGSETATLANIYVLPELWGEGIGTSLLTNLRTRLRGRGFDDLRAVVLADNEAGIPFYESKGFDRVGDRTEEIGDETHDVVVFEQSL